MNIEKQADLFEQRISGWEENALRRTIEESLPIGMICAG